MSHDRYYRQSGKVPVLALILMPVFGVTSGVVLGAIYGAVTNVNPIVKVNFFLAAGLSYAVAWVVVLGARLGRARNAWVVGTFAGVAALVALYVAWVFWAIAVLRGPVSFLRPDVVWRTALHVHQVGAWSFFSASQPVKGLTLTLVWLAEAVTIIGLAIYRGVTVTSEQVFCAGCGRWKARRRIFSFAPLTDPSALRAELEAGGDGFLLHLRPPLSGSKIHTDLVVQNCRHCKDRAYLTVEAVTTRKDKGKAAKVSTVIIEPIIVEHGMPKLLEEWLNQSPDESPADNPSGSSASVAVAPEGPSNVRDDTADALASMDNPESSGEKPR